MTLEGKTIGVALTGSFCTYSKAFPQIEVLVKEGAAVQTIFSNASQTIDSRFGSSEEFKKRAEELTGRTPIYTTLYSSINQYFLNSYLERHWLQ